MTEPRIILVTGASSGIGLATAELLLQQGDRVIGISRRDASAHLQHDRFESVQLDLSQSDRIDATLDELNSRCTIDGLVHAAGSGHFGSIEQFSAAQIESSLSINLTSAILLGRALIPGMRRRGRGRAGGPRR